MHISISHQRSSTIASKLSNPCPDSLPIAHPRFPQTQSCPDNRIRFMMRLSQALNICLQIITRLSCKQLNLLRVMPNYPRIPYMTRKILFEKRLWIRVIPRPRHFPKLRLRESADITKGLPTAEAAREPVVRLREGDLDVFCPAE